MKTGSINLQKTVRIFYNVSALKPSTKLLVSILFGLVSFVLSPYGFSSQIAEVTINIPWIIILPIMASLAFGWRYGFISGITGAAFYPFLLWPEEGWLNVLTTFLYLVFFTSIGIVNGIEITHGYRRLMLKFSIVFILFVGLLYLSFYNLINPLLSLNPPFWFKNTINCIDPSFLNAFAIKDSINVLLITIVADTLLCLPLIRRLFDLEVLKTMRHNHRIFGAVIVSSILLWLIFVGLDFSLLNKHTSQHDGHLLLTLLVILSGGIIAARVLIYYAERQLSTKYELIDNQIKFKTVADFTYDWEYWDGADNQLIYMSPSCERISGYTPQEFFADYTLIKKIVYPDDSGLFNRHFENSHNENLIHNIGNFDFRITKKDGSIVHISHLCRPVFDKAGNYFGRRISNRDVTERKLADNALKESEEKYRNLIELAVDGILIGSYEGIIIEANSQLCLMIGKNRNEIIGQPIQNLPFTKQSIENKPFQFKLLQSGETIVTEREIYRTDGSTLIVEMRSKMMPDRTYQSIFRDITERKETDRKLLSTIIETEEKERNRFSRDLHDGLGPLLSTIKLYFQWLSETDDLEKKKLITERGDKNLNEAIESIREISNNLSPRTLNTFGVEVAIKNFVNCINQTQKLTVTFQLNAKDRFDKNSEITIYRIVTELLNNTVKYAKASKSTIELLIDNNNEWIALSYTDNGNGYDPISIQDNSKGFGLINITQRVNALNGKISVVSSIGNGIQVSIELPLNKK
ncbi:MAG: PAS domain S-box protein [Salinivirgaceae bacterium]